MKRTAAAAAILAAVIVAQGTASADGYRMKRQPDVWTGHFRHMARHHGDWRWRRAAIINQNNAGLIAGYAAPDYGARYYGAAYGADYGHPAAPRYADSARSGCYSGCAPVYPSCYSYSYGCRPAYSACGHYGGCGGWMGYSRCGGC